MGLTIKDLSASIDEMRDEMKEQNDETRQEAKYSCYRLNSPSAASCNSHVHAKGAIRLILYSYLKCSRSAELILFTIKAENEKKQ